ncbi:Ribulose-phosphate 3-epimerase [Nosema bombycis CQ1]|uniref:Ribulose-phosphate 3-epimerase n=1 Tax=Nosema bombycis (strain CQ1 / CVCC 102059) TaxID=578461 RepID=R0M6C7_NOSB1|nr:Ribulose-phosphate 3-epimerase [Nosema bombycis CQ1]|eukprot:EOB13549.1 Ribulose-phosphate 3-epimerase [Nosema bombycis CQ1]
MDRISISLLDANLLSLDTVLNDLQTNGIKRIHLDILDTSFVDNISFGPGLVNKILQYNFKFDVHIMVNYPLKVIKLLDVSRIDFVIVPLGSRRKRRIYKISQST